MTERELYLAIDMPEEAISRLEQTVIGLAKDREEELISRLCSNEYDGTVHELKELLAPDEDGWKILALMLRAALRSLEMYEKRGISRQVFVDTMGCFSRFVREHKESFGRYGFDREFWTGRQLSLNLFRLGTLEYEHSLDGDEKIISIHIPSDADLSAQAIEESVSFSKEFLAKFDGEYADVKYTCFSWLLAPALKQVLPPQSRILYFQSLFDVKTVQEDNDGYKLWVYKNSALKPEEFPENTTLQRNLKKYVLAGGKVGEAYGIMRN